MKFLIKIFFFLVLIFFGVNITYAQKKVKGSNFHENQNLFGSKKKEKSNQSKALSKRKSFFNRKFSAGNADAFASNKLTGRKGLIAKLFKPGSQYGRNASLRKTRPGKIQNREQTKLFGKYQSHNKKRNNAFLSKQNKRRNMSRVRGNSVFSKRNR